MKRGLMIKGGQLYASLFCFLCELLSDRVTRMSDEFREMARQAGERAAKRQQEADALRKPFIEGYQNEAVVLKANALPLLEQAEEAFEGEDIPCFFDRRHCMEDTNVLIDTAWDIHRNEPKFQFRHPFYRLIVGYSYPDSYPYNWGRKEEEHSCLTISAKGTLIHADLWLGFDDLFGDGKLIQLGEVDAGESGSLIMNGVKQAVEAYVSHIANRT